MRSNKQFIDPKHPMQTIILNTDILAMLAPQIEKGEGERRPVLAAVNVRLNHPTFPVNDGGEVSQEVDKSSGEVIYTVTEGKFFATVVDMVFPEGSERLGPCNISQAIPHVPLMPGEKNITEINLDAKAISEILKRVKMAYKGHPKAPGKVEFYGDKRNGHRVTLKRNKSGKAEVHFDSYLKDYIGFRRGKKGRSKPDDANPFGVDEVAGKYPEMDPILSPLNHQEVEFSPTLNPKYLGKITSLAGKLSSDSNVDLNFSPDRKKPVTVTLSGNNRLYDAAYDVSMGIMPVKNSAYETRKRFQKNDFLTGSVEVPFTTPYDGKTPVESYLHRQSQYPNLIEVFMVHQFWLADATKDSSRSAKSPRYPGSFRGIRYIIPGDRSIHDYVATEAFAGTSSEGEFTLHRMLLTEEALKSLPYPVEDYRKSKKQEAV